MKLSKLSNNELTQLEKELANEKINRAARSLSNACGKSVCGLSKAGKIVSYTVNEFNKSMSNVKEMTDRFNCVEALCLLCSEDRLAIMDIVDKTVRKTSMSYNDIKIAITVFSKGKIICLKDTIKLIARMKDKGVKASECGRVLAKYYRELVYLGLKPSLIKTKDITY